MENSHFSFKKFISSVLAQSYLNLQQECVHEKTFWMVFYHKSADMALCTHRQQSDTASQWQIEVSYPIINPSIGNLKANNFMFGDFETWVKKRLFVKLLSKIMTSSFQGRKFGFASIGRKVLISQKHWLLGIIWKYSKYFRQMIIFSCSNFKIRNSARLLVQERKYFGQINALQWYFNIKNCFQG